jgi:hypothetical protein
VWRHFAVSETTWFTMLMRTLPDGVRILFDERPEPPMEGAHAD